MIWIDSSFAIEWLAGMSTARKVRLPQGPLGILSMQYLEVFIFFLRQGQDPLAISRELERLELRNPERVHLQYAGPLYLDARKKKSKASLADALLAAVSHIEEEGVLSFDRDFATLGLKARGALWFPTIQ